MLKCIHREKPLNPLHVEYVAGYIRFISLQLLSCDAEIILCKLI